MIAIRDRGERASCTCMIVLLAIATAACTSAVRSPRVTGPRAAPRRPAAALDFTTPLPDLAVDDVAFVAEVFAREVRFDVVPTTIVTFSTPIAGRTVYAAIRHNIPRPVLAGVTYRQVRARVVIATSLPSFEHALATLDTAPLPPATARPPSIPHAGGMDVTR